MCMYLYICGKKEHILHISVHMNIFQEINVNKIKPNLLCRTREGLSEQPVTYSPIHTICPPNPSSLCGPFHVGIISEAQSSSRVFAPSRLVMTQLQFQGPSTSQPFQDLVWACPASLPSPECCGYWVLSLSPLCSITDPGSNRDPASCQGQRMGSEAERSWFLLWLSTY